MQHNRRSLGLAAALRRKLKSEHKKIVFRNRSQDINSDKIDPSKPIKSANRRTKSGRLTITAIMEAFRKKNGL